MQLNHGVVLPYFTVKQEWQHSRVVLCFSVLAGNLGVFNPRKELKLLLDS